MYKTPTTSIGNTNQQGSLMKVHEKIRKIRELKNFSQECGGLIVFAPLQFVLNFAQTLATSTMQPIVPTPTMTLPFSKKR